MKTVSGTLSFLHFNGLDSKTNQPFQIITANKIFLEIFKGEEFRVLQRQNKISLEFSKLKHIKLYIDHKLRCMCNTNMSLKIRGEL